MTSRTRLFGLWLAYAMVVSAALSPAVWAEEAAPPAKKSAAPPAARIVPDDLELLRDVEFGKGGDRPLKMDILRPKQPPAGPMPVVVYIHGGAWRGGSKNNMPGLCTALVQQGYFCASIEYRLSQEAIYPAQIEDCKCAIRFLRAHAKDYKINPDRVGVWGHSAGGHLVALLGVTGDAKDLEGKGGWQDQPSRVQAVVDCYGPTDFVILAKDPSAPQGGMGSPVAGLLGKPPSEAPDLAAKASPIAYVSKDAAPILILHGDEDKTVPLQQGERFYEALKKAGADVTMHVVKGAGHGFKAQDVDGMIKAFFDKHLKAK